MSHRDEAQKKSFQALRGQEDAFWPFTDNGRPLLRNCQNFSSSPYPIDFIDLFQPPKHQNKVFLQQKFIVEGLSAAQIAKEFGCSKTAVKDHLRKFGIRKNTPTGKTRHNLAIGQRILKGRPTAHKGEIKLLENIKDMHIKEDLSATAIARILNGMKTPTKKQGKAWDHSVIIAILKRQSIYQSQRGSRNTKLLDD